jgi:tetratricopeptide (TPR) repeat protein
MRIRNGFIIAWFLLWTFASLANAETADVQLYSLFNQANEAFRQANAASNDPQQADKLYETAILNYGAILERGGIENAKLYYNLANAYFLKGDIGRALLNYRRAQRLDSSDVDIQKNLAFARSRRIDQVNVQAKKKVLDTLFFWHYDFSLAARFSLCCIFFGLFCAIAAVMVWRGRAAGVTAIAVISVVLMVCMLASVLVETQYLAKKAYGVITAEQVTARQGDGTNYQESFREPLHAGTEFNVADRRSGWLHIKLADGSDGWIPENAAEII